MVKSRAPAIDAALLDAVEAHPRDLTRTVAQQTGVSRQAVASRARTLVEAGFLARSGSTRPTYVRGPKRRAGFEYARAHPSVELVAMHATSEVQQMIRRAEVARDRDDNQLRLL